MKKILVIEDELEMRRLKLQPTVRIGPLDGVCLMGSITVFAKRLGMHPRYFGPTYFLSLL